MEPMPQRWGIGYVFEVNFRARMMRKILYNI
jgi:hypothetical protein